MKMHQNKLKFRLLPVIIFLCAIIFSLKIESMWNTSSTTEKTKVSLVAMTSAQAQKVDPISANNVTSEEKNNSEDELNANPANLLTSTIESPDENPFSNEELQVLQNLAKRRQEIEEKEKELELKMATLNAAEIQIDVKVAKLQELEKSIKTLVDAYDNKEKTQLDSLVTIYSNMKPKDAARIFNDLDMDILVKLFTQMKETKAATILSAMDSAKANALTLELANKNRPDFIKNIE